MPEFVSGLRAALDVGIKFPPDFVKYTDAEKIAWANANRVTPQQLTAIGINKEDLDYLQRFGYKPPGSTTLATAPKGLSSLVSSVSAPTLNIPTQLVGPQELPKNWNTFTPEQKIAFYNYNKITPDRLLSVGVPQSDLNWMLPRGYKVPGQATLASPSYETLTAPTLSTPSSTAITPAFQTLSEADLGPVVTKNIGGPIAFDKGGMAKYSLEDFGITPATVDQAREQGVFNVPRDVLFGPELKGIEAAILAAMPPAEREKAMRQLMVRQGRTGAEYFPASSFERVAPASYRGEVGAYRPEYLYQYAEGGGVGRGLGSIAMKGYAQEMAQKGRFGDTMLAHISPEEAQMLQAMGGAGTINPQTGLPEYFSWRKLIKKIAPIIQFAAPFIPGIGLPLKVALSGLAGGFAGPGKGFDFKRGLISGAMAYAGGKFAEGLGAAGQAGSAGSTTMQALGGQDALNAAAGFDTAGTNFDLAGSAGAPISAASPSMLGTSPGPSMGAKVLDAGQNMYQGAENLISGAPGSSEAFKQAAGYSPTTLGAGMVAGYGALQGADEATKFQLQQQLATAKTEEEREEIRDLIRRLFGPIPVSPPVPMATGGMAGLSALASGGATGPANEPRTINGAGDGMSDSVPATIEGVQEARLADGEFVIPADVVADLGNGSSNAGSKKLYAMMDRVRKARHGTTEQPPEVDTGRLMPA